MSHAGVETRLKQFIKGLEDGRQHSAAMRFFREIANRLRYSKLPKKEVFYVASVCVPCVSKKAHRTPDDLRKMGTVAALEINVLARIKEKTGREPKLNKH